MSIYHQIFHPLSNWQSPANIQMLESYMYLSRPIEVKIEASSFFAQQPPSQQQNILTEDHSIASSIAINTKILDVSEEVSHPLVPVTALPSLETNLDSNSATLRVLLHNALEFPKPAAIKSENKKKPGLTQFFPRKPDTLFWSIYISLHGMKEYDQIGLHYGNVEIEEKQKMMELMKKTPNLIKNANKKITKVLSQEIMSDFMTNKRTTIDMLMIFAIYNNMRIILVNVDEKNQPDKSYIILGSQIYTRTVVIYKKKNNYGLEMDYQEPVMDETLATLFCMEQIDKPLKAISNYKIDELEAIAYKLNVDYTTNKLKKQELYNGILMALTSILG